jgi:hypothetical protein
LLQLRRNKRPPNNVVCAFATNQLQPYAMLCYGVNAHTQAVQFEKPISLKAHIS